MKIGRRGGSRGLFLTLRRREELRELETMTLPVGRLDDLRPVLRRDVAAVAPLSDGDTELTNVRSHRLGVVFPDGVNGFEVRHKGMIRDVSPTSIPRVSAHSLLNKRMAGVKA